MPSFSLQIRLVSFLAFTAQIAIYASRPWPPPPSEQRHDVAHSPSRRWRKPGLRRSAEGPRFIVCWCGRLMTALLNLIRPTCQLRSQTICQWGASKVGHAGAVERPSRHCNNAARSFRALGTPALMAGSVATGWILIGSLLLLLPLHCQMLLIYSIRDIHEVYQELLTGFCRVKREVHNKYIVICRRLNWMVWNAYVSSRENLQNVILMCTVHNGCWRKSL